MTGAWPKYRVDHINRDRADNRWVNLRDASPMVNNQNITKASKRNRLGVRGVSAHQGGFRARIMARGAVHELGVFDTIEAAAAVYAAAKLQLHAVD